MKIDDLVHQAAAVIPLLAGPTARHKVAPIPDARTVRYYIREGLVDPPHGSSGPAALYRYRHLLQLVAVKVLQSHYLPIRKIRETIVDLTDRELEKLVESWAARPMPAPPATPLPAPGRVAEPVAADLLAAEPVSPGSAAPAGGAGASARAYLESIDRRRAVSPVIAPGATPPIVVHDVVRSAVSVEQAAPDGEPAGAPADTGRAGWTRHELYPGIELHVREGVGIPISPSFLSALASRMKSILEKLIPRK